MLPGGGPQSLGITELAKADTVQQKQIIGEHLYRAIEPLNPSKAGKITGRQQQQKPDNRIHAFKQITLCK